MNEGQDGYPQDPYQLLGYDEYGRPVYGHPDAAQQQQHQQGYGYDPYNRQPAYDPYPQGRQGYAQPQQGQGYGYGQGEGQGQGQGQGYDPYGAGQQQAAPAAGAQHAQQARQAAQVRAQQAQQAQQDTRQWIPQQQPVTQNQAHNQAQDPAQYQQQTGYQQGPRPPQDRQPRRRPPGAAQVPEQRRPAEPPSAAAGDEYRTEQFSFIEEPDEDAEDVIDWLKFTESRTERREEARRRGRNRIVALCVVLALTLVGGVGYLWYAGKLPGLSGEQGTDATTASGPQKRDVIVVHLHDTKSGGTSTALLVDNVTTKRGTTVLLPNSLAVSTDDGSATTLGNSVENEGPAATREALDTLLGTRIGGTWRLDTPYLDNLVELVGGVVLDTDVTVPAAKEGESPLVKKGEDQTLGGQTAVAYATYRGPGEGDTQQLKRFGQVMQAVLKKISDKEADATDTVKALAQIPDPSLSENDLGASLAKLAEHAKIGDYQTALLPVEPDGTLSEEATGSVVKDVLGGTVTAPEQGAAVRVGVKNASGDQKAIGDARVDLVNGGYTFVDGGTAATPETASRITYADAARKADALEVAKTLGLGTSVVKKGEVSNNADVSVVLGRDFETG